MRAIFNQALYSWRLGKIDEALDIFRKLLKVNPGDNQGVRFCILAIRMSLDVEEWQKPFEVEQDGAIIGLSPKVVDWFETNAPHFEDDFKWLLDLYQSWENSNS